MTEHAILTLLGIASVATAITGFSGVVAVFGGRADGQWSPADRFRTKNMLILSLGACLLSFLPLTEELFQVADRWIWISASSVLVVFCAVYFVYTAVMLRTAALRRRGALINWVRIVYFVCLTLAIVLQALNVAGAVVERNAAPYVAGLIFILIPAGLQFAFLVLTPLTEPPAKE
jgi:hypothetical protein